MNALRHRFYRLLRWSERYTKTDMVYLASGGFWLTFGQIGAAVFTLVLAIVFGHIAAQDTYGNYKYILSIASLLSALSLSGLGTAVTRAAARGNEGALKQGAWLSLRWSALFVIAGLAASAYYYAAGNIFACVGIALATLTLPFLNSLSLYDSFLVGIRDFRLETLYALGSLALTTIALVISLLFFSQRAIILIALYFATNLVTDAIWYYRTLRRTRNDRSEPELLSYGFHLSIMGVIGAIADKIDSIIVFAMLGPASLAVYSYAIAMPEQIKGLIKNVGLLAMPRFANRSLGEIKRSIWPRVIFLCAGTAITIIVYILLVPYLFKYLFPVYISSIGYSQLFVVSLIFSFIVPFLSVFQAHKKLKELYIMSNATPIFLLIALPILTYYLGIFGAILSQLLFRTLNALVTTILFLRMRD